LLLQCEVSQLYARGTSFLFPETQISLKELFETKETKYHIIFLIFRLIWRNKSFVNDFLIVEECDQYRFNFFSIEFDILYILKILASVIPCFVFLFRDHTGNTTYRHPLQQNQTRKDHHSQAE
jgi:hypothetical protein